MELLAVLLALFVLATPALAVYAVWRQHKLRRQFEDLAQHSAQANDALHRELAELRRQVSAVPPSSLPKQPQSAPAHSAETPVPIPAAASRPVEEVLLSTSRPVESASKPESPKPPSIEAPPARPQPSLDKSMPAFCAWCGTVHAGGVSNCPVPPPVAPSHDVQAPALTRLQEKIPALRESIAGTPAAPSTEKPVEKVVEESIEKGVEESKREIEAVHPSSPSTTASVPPVIPTVPPAPKEPATPPRSATPSAPPPHETPHTRPPSAVPPPPSVRVAAPPQVAPLRASSSQTTAQQRMKSVFALEETLGTNWLNKLGIAILVLGVALFGIYELGQLGRLGKVFLSYSVSLALLGGGIFVEKRDRYRVLGHTLIGGGWALLFFSTYAMYHVPAMRVLDGETLDLILMLAVALVMVMHTLRYRSQVVTGLAFLLAYSTVTLSHDDVYSLSAGVILAGGLVAIVLKMGWFELEVFGILSSYLNHLYWLTTVLHVKVTDATGLLHMEGARGHAFPEYHASTGLLLFYWLIFRISYIVRKTKSVSQEHVSTAAALLNTLLLLGVMKFQSVHPELAFTALLLIGAIEFGCGQLPITRRRREAFIVLTVLGAALMIAAVPFRYSGNNVAILWLVGGEALLAAGVVVGEVVFRRLGLLTGLLVGVHLAAFDLMQVLAVRRTSEDRIVDAGVMFALCAIVFYVNALFVGQRWRHLIGISVDAELLSMHSYLGGFAATMAAWAWLSRDWTALGFAAVMLMLAALGIRFKSSDLAVQYSVIGVATLWRAYSVNLHIEIPPPLHVPLRLWTFLLLAIAFYATAKLSEVKGTPLRLPLRDMFAAAGTLLVIALGIAEVPELWQPLSAIAFAVALLEFGRWTHYPVLAWHTHVVSALAILAAFTADQASLHRWYTIPVHAIAAIPVVVGAYWIAKRIRLTIPRSAFVACALYTWAAAALVVWGLNEALSEPWSVVGWIIFAVLLARSTRWIRYQHLAWQADAVALLALFRAFAYNLTLEQIWWHGITLRIVTVVIVAAGLYFISRKPLQSNAEYSRLSAYFLSSAATALLAVLAWYEAPGGWLAAVWALFALVLALVDRRFKLNELGWQAHALALLTLARCITVNLYVTDTWHGLSIRLLSISIVAVVFYALSTVLRLPEDWRTREFHHAYSWAASALVATLMWYELQPLSVAVGWAVFGLVLFEYGLVRKVRQFRFQAYVALAAAFARIFFANLTAGQPGELWPPRMFTVRPISLILFFVYSQLGPDETAVHDDRDLYCDVLLAYFGTASIAALFYFQFAADWVVTSWAAIVLVLFAVALLLDRVIFLHQALLLTVGVCTRGIMHNLFGASYFRGGDWTGRYFVLGSAVAILFACLVPAFRFRDRYKAQKQPRGWMTAVLTHPEQFMFFAPVLLLTLMLAIKMRAGMVTVAWGIEGVLIVLLALAVKERSFRLTGFIMLLLCVAKLIFRDAFGLAPRDRIITFIILGAALVLVSFLYTRYRETIRQFL